MDNIETKLAEVEQRAKSNTHRLDDQEKRIDNIEDLTTSVKVLATREERVEKDVKEIKADVKELTSRPAQHWNGLIDKVLYAIIGAFLAWLLTGGAV